MNLILVIDNRFTKEALIEHASRQLHLLPKDWEYKVWRDAPISSLTDYNKLLSHRDFWVPLLKYDRVLICQTDAEILRPGIEEFMEYDYVGAPWKFQEHGGNGGFSLRNPKTMFEIATVYKYRNEALDGYEDVYFCNNIDKVGGKLAPREVCKRFALETIFELGTFGAHAIDKYFTAEQCNLIRNQY